jgi:hypothetical protein
MATHKKNLFLTNTALSIYATLFIVITPTMNLCASENRLPNVGESIQMLMALMTSGLGLAARYGANDETFTPGMIPGRSASDVDTLVIKQQSVLLDKTDKTEV